MYRWLRIAAVLCIAGVTSLGAQQACGLAPQAAAAAAPASSSGSALPGPRLEPEWRSVQPEFADRSVSATPVSGGTHTITVTTLVLVLVVIIAVLLIAK